MPNSTGITVSDLILTEIGNDLEITFAGDPAAKLTITNQNVAGNEIELIQFSDGTTLQLAALPPNTDPVAQDDQFTLIENNSLAGDLLADNGNGADFDPDDEMLSVTAQSFMTAQGGSVSILADGRFTYTPDADFFGTDGFDYTLNDLRGGSDTGTVLLTIEPLINRNPEAQTDLIEGFENNDVNGNVLIDNGNGADFDPDGDNLTVVATTTGTVQGGVISLQANGDFIYSPPFAFTGQDRFDYTVIDGQGGSDRGTILIDVSASNQPPDAKDDDFTAVIDTDFSGNVLDDSPSSFLCR